jgi:hypothetical protein
MKETRKVYRVLVAKYFGKQPLGTPRKRRQANVKMDLGETCCQNGMDHGTGLGPCPVAGFGVRDVGI